MPAEHNVIAIRQILGGYPDVGSHFWVLWPIFAFIAFAVALLAGTLQSLIGPMGTLAAKPPESIDPDEQIGIGAIPPG